MLHVFGADGKLVKSIDLSDRNIHGAVYYDATFGGIAVSGDLTQAAFIAEAKDVKSCPFFKEGDGVDRGQESLYKDDFGEQFENKRSPTIVQLDLKTYELKVTKCNLPENWCAGQLVYHPDGKSLLGSAYILGPLPSAPRRLGIWACSNRPRVIFILDLGTGGFRTISREKNVAAESPRISPDGKFLYWMERDIGDSGIEFGPHQACRRLVRRRLDDGDIGKGEGDVETVVPIVRSESGIDGFGGLFIGEMPKRLFSADGRFMFLNTVNAHSKILLVVDVETKDVAVVEGPDCSDCLTSVSVLDVHLDFVLAEESALNMPPVVMCASLDTNGDVPLGQRLTFTLPRIKSDVKLPLECYTVSPDFFKGGASILVMPNYGVSACVPLIVFLHGGPHSSYQDSFNKQVFFFSQLGYAVLMVNYVGSTGNGQDGIYALDGQVGILDVQDCYDTVQYCLGYNGSLDTEAVYLFGGSHGGFLTLHLAGKYPDAFKGVVVRNPVTNRSTKAAGSDIPDIESNYAGLSYDYLALEPDAMHKLYEVSPIAHIRNIAAPVCLFLGKRDRRVPPYQGREFYHALRALKKKARMYEYEDNHSLAKVSTAANAMVNAAKFFFEQRM